jgi:hypothetical protein
MFSCVFYDDEFEDGAGSRSMAFGCAFLYLLGCQHLYLHGLFVEHDYMISEESHEIDMVMASIAIPGKKYN